MFNSTWFDGGVGYVDYTYAACQQGIIHSIYEMEYSDDRPSGNPVAVLKETRVIPVSSEGIAAHPNWGWLAVKGNVVCAFRHRSAARRWVNA